MYWWNTILWKCTFQTCFAHRRKKIIWLPSSLSLIPNMLHISLFRSLPFSISFSLSYFTHTHMHMHTCSLSLSLSLSHKHTHARTRKKHTLPLHLLRSHALWSNFPRKKIWQIFIYESILYFNVLGCSGWQNRAGALSQNEKDLAPFSSVRPSYKTFHWRGGENKLERLWEKKFFLMLHLTFVTKAEGLLGWNTLVVGF